MPLNRREFIAGVVPAAGLAAMPFEGWAAKTKRPIIPMGGVEKWGMYEIALTGPAAGNPFVDVSLVADFVQGDQTLRVPGFYDGNGTYRVRFSPPAEGVWRWTSVSSTAALDGKTGQFTAAVPTAGNHGPVRVTPDGYHFAFADGTPFRQIGTTCYSWAQQSDARCAQTLKTLSTAPYNKMRMLVFPNVAAEPIFAFEKTGPAEEKGNWDLTRFNAAYFQRYEARVKALCDLGVQADIILFHPYDKKRGFSDMTRSQDEHYLRYIIARLGAYRNVWWSLANEYDLIATKSMDDWDHLFQFIRSEDPYGRLRSIHNIKRFYDNRKPWVTHASIQNGTAVLDDRTAETYRSVWEKPVIFDEVCYEGNIDARWGRLSGEEMVMRFWNGHVAGTYVGHSETFTPDNSGADGSWLGKGGGLRGQSTPRLAFLKSIMEAGPAPGIDPIDKWWERHMGGKAGAYYLHYFAAEAPSQWAVILPKNELSGGEVFRIDLLDTWNMTITPVDGTFTMAKLDAYNFSDPKRPSIELPGRPWMAVRVVRAS